MPPEATPDEPRVDPPNTALTPSARQTQLVLLIYVGLLIPNGDNLRDLEALSPEENGKLTTMMNWEGLKVA